MRTLTPDESVYRPVGLLKESRYGVVSLLETAGGERLVARQIVPPEGVDVGQSMGHLARELKRLEHPGLPHFDAMTEGQGGYWLLFRYVEGIPLTSFEGVTIPPEWALQWLAEVLSILDYLHTRPLRWPLGYFDPSDLVLAGDRLVLVDLALTDHLFPQHNALYRAGSRSPFMAPEAHHARAPQPPSDLYSAGALGWWLLTGYPPGRHVDWNPGPPQILDRLLEADPTRRGDAWSVLHTLKASLVPRDSLSAPPAPNLYTIKHDRS